jgi:hypothetical protein
MAERVRKNVNLEPIVSIQPEVSERKPTRWKKIGGGTFLFNNHYIKPNQEFTAFEEEIPKQFLGLLVALDKVTPTVDPLQTRPVNVNYKLEETTDGWNIVDLNGKKFNEGLLTKENAEKILKIL